MDKAEIGAKNSFGSYVQAERLRHGYTQDQLAELCDISKDQIQNIEINKRKPSFDSLIAIMTTLDLSFDRFVFLQNDSNEADMLIDRIRLLPDHDVVFMQDTLNALDNREKKRKSP